jgi:hypothetical protein
LENFFAAANHFKLTCGEFFCLFEARKLSTSRRQSLRQLVTSLPSLHKGFSALLIVTASTFRLIQAIDDDKCDKNFPRQTKLLKPSMSNRERFSNPIEILFFGFVLCGRDFEYFHTEVLALLQPRRKSDLREKQNIFISDYCSSIDF